MNQPLNVFISYSHHDEAIKNALVTHLASLKREKKISPWQDQMIEAGDNWDDAIRQALKIADIVLLLVTPDFINSDYCFNKEMKEALKRHKRGDTRVIPIIARPSDWKSTPLGKLQALPKELRAIKIWDNEDEAFLSIVQDLRCIVESLSSKIGKKSTKLKTRDIDRSTASFYQKEESFEAKVKERCQQNIITQHSHIRLLSGQRIGVDQLYVDVCMLERPTRSALVSQKKFQKDFNLRGQRLRRNNKREPGIQIARNHSKIVVLGKPGSGKTT
ncbi:MAG: toll/interleukin-1 receptor domain-containing protein, partial [Cyanobacteria bacterium P01_F01_bin.53]